MKPLELHIYDKHPDADAYRVGGFYSPYCLVSRDKRFSEAELAAEFWFMEAVCADLRARGARGDAKPSDVLAASADLSTMERFATLPHYDEADQ